MDRMVDRRADRTEGAARRPARRDLGRVVMAVILVASLCAGAQATDGASQDQEGQGWMERISATWDRAKSTIFGSKDDLDPVAAPDDRLPGPLAASWGKLTGTLSDALTLRDEQDSLPSSSWFGRDKASNAKKIDALLDQALEILLQGRAVEIRREAIALRARIPELRQEVDRLRNERITAPEKSSVPWKTTRAKLDARMAEVEQEIRSCEGQLASLDAALGDALRELGVELDQTQVDVLLSSVTGDGLLQNAVVFTNVRAVVEQLETLSQKDRGDLEIARRYTGMYLVLNDLLIHTQEELVRKIDEDHRPRLLEIVKEAEGLRAAALAKSREKGYTDEQRKAFALNAESNAMTVRAGRLYAELLGAQRKSILDGLVGLRRGRDLAENTYRTVRSSGDLRDLIRSGLSLFDTISALAMPKLQPFESDAMRKEFEEIDKRLRR